MSHVFDYLEIAWGWYSSLYSRRTHIQNEDCFAGNIYILWAWERIIKRHPLNLWSINGFQMKIPGSLYSLCNNNNTKGTHLKDSSRSHYWPFVYEYPYTTLWSSSHGQWLLQNYYKNEQKEKTLFQHYVVKEEI